MVQKLEQALHTIKSTMYHHKSDAYFPYFFIVGAGISVPEIPSASKIVDICKETVKEIDPERFVKYEEESKPFLENGMKYYSSWIEYAYPNRINRSQLFKGLCSKAKISSANLMLAQILHSGKFANTVFTTNFDDSIKKALELMGTKSFFCAENIMDNLVVNNQTKDIQVIHVHGTFNFYDCANLEKEIDGVASQTGAVSSAQLLSSFLYNQAPIIVGYSGWENDVIMRCLKERLNYPTPLQYIWICYNKQSYQSLPDWIKEKDSVIFVVPESDDGDCDDTKDTLAWDASSNANFIDATTFFKRIISGFKLDAPLIFTDPYSYYSQKIQTVLPKNEDVLHLRHWTQRLKIIESDNVFENLVQRLETIYIAKDYNEANNVLREIIGLPLSGANAEFVCTSLIKEFIRDEDAIPSFDIRLKFHLTALDFVEKNISQLSHIDGLISTLRAILFTRFRHTEKSKVLELLEKVIELCIKDSRLLVIELTAIGMKSDFVEKELKLSLLQQVLTRCPNDTKNKDFVFLRYKALRETARLSRSNEAISLIEEADNLVTILDRDIYSAYLYLTKSEVLPYITRTDVKEQWMMEILKFLSSPDDDIDIDTYVEVAANLSILTDDEIFGDTRANQVEDTITKLLLNYAVDHTNCHSILHYSQCCELICRATKADTTVADFCKKVFAVMPLFPHKCKGYLMSLKYLANKFLSLPADVVNEFEKIDLIAGIKENEHTDSLYFHLLHYASSCELINDFSRFSDDIAYVLEQQEKAQNGYERYCSGDYKQAEIMFSEVINCKVPLTADSARTNLAYMIRRNETEKSYSFEEIIDQLVYWSEFDLMNILLYYIAKGETNNKTYIKAKEKFEKISEEERNNIIEWWSNVERVGEKESKLALSLINRSEQ
ncbi:MAG: SIR2 family protein [Oscillospiraceae bacterium]|nr:SIR2 family protein [Oscillospiraceae bacterium]